MREWLDSPVPGYRARVRRLVRCADPACGWAWEATWRLDRETGTYWSDQETCPICDGPPASS